MQLPKEQLEPLRYERKYLIADYSFPDILQLIKFHPACFSEIYHERYVNNIYFDTLGMNNYFENVEGNKNRKKVRIRWYGDLMGQIKSPVLEYKIKKGLLGYKVSYNLKPFTLDLSFSKSRVNEVLNDKAIPNEVKNDLLSLQPLLLNRYKRKYFLSADKNFRITIDHELSYYKIGYNKNTFLNKSADHYSTIVELKYDSSLETEADKVSSEFPFMLTKNSKYLSGLERLYI